VPDVDARRAAEEVSPRHVGRGFPAVIVNPGYMLGPWDTRPTSGRMILEIARGWAFLAPRGGNCFLDVRDAANGVVAALERGQVGRRYILGGENLTYLEAWRRIATIVGRRGPIGTAPTAGTCVRRRSGGRLVGAAQRRGAGDQPRQCGHGRAPPFLRFRSRPSRARLSGDRLRSRRLRRVAVVPGAWLRALRAAERTVNLPAALSGGP